MKILKDSTYNKMIADQNRADSYANKWMTMHGDLEIEYDQLLKSCETSCEIIRDLQIVTDRFKAELKESKEANIRVTTAWAKDMDRIKILSEQLTRAQAVIKKGIK